MAGPAQGLTCHPRQPSDITSGRFFAANMPVGAMPKTIPEEVHPLFWLPALQPASSRNTSGCFQGACPRLFGYTAPSVGFPMQCLAGRTHWRGGGPLVKSHWLSGRDLGHTPGTREGGGGVHALITGPMAEAQVLGPQKFSQSGLFPSAPRPSSCTAPSSAG